MNRHNKWLIGLVIVWTETLVSCGDIHSGNNSAPDKLTIFHAGSLTLPFHEAVESFEAVNPGTKVFLEAAGSRECARKITEMNKPCDIIATSDYAVIETLLIPEYSEWQIAFAKNEMCIAYQSSSKASSQIHAENWTEVLLSDSIIFGRSDPNADPCGYRTLFLFELAERYYQASDLSDRLKDKNTEFIRPKEVDLLALLESHAIDYLFIYKSVAKQHGLSFIELPDQINLGNPAFADFYGSASTELSGKTMNETIIQKGEPMLYGISILKNAPNKTLAVKFLLFLLTPDKGMMILEENGQPTMVDSNSKYLNILPEEIKDLLSHEKG